MRGADEAAGIVALGLLGLVVDEARGLEVRAHALRAGEPGGVDAGLVHHAHVLVEIVEQLVNGVARRALRVVVQDQPVARVLLDQLARREVVLEIDDHRVRFLSEFRAAGRPRLAPDCKPEWQPRCQPERSPLLAGPECESAAGPQVLHYATHSHCAVHLPRRSGPCASVLMR